MLTCKTLPQRWQQLNEKLVLALHTIKKTEESLLLTMQRILLDHLLRKQQPPFTQQQQCQIHQAIDSVEQSLDEKINLQQLQSHLERLVSLVTPGLS